MKSALFLDFEDSFTYNVIQELEQSGLRVEVRHWSDFSGEESFDLLVLGPGPGHPDDYQQIFPLLTEMLKQKEKIFGVCLGHQILWRLQGVEVSRSLLPVHGQKIELTLDSDWMQFLQLPERIRVQRYNSLAVKSDQCPEGFHCLIQDGEVVMSRNSHLLSYQFHPESVGTSCRQSFFRPILRDLL